MSTRFSCTGILLFMAALLSVLLVSQNAYAQKKEVCGFDARFQRQMATPQIARQITEANAGIGRKQNDLKSIRQLHKNREVQPGPIYQIPVVVHVLYRPADAIPGSPGTPNDYDNNSTDNPTDASIHSMIAFLNQVYAGTYAAGGISTPIRFVLAKRGPDCNATTGIIRKEITDQRYVNDGLMDGDTGPGMPESELLAESKWPRNEYYNIWIVHKIGDGGTNGYAYFPNRYNDNDGTVLDARVVNGTALTLPHEIGHALALYHTFESKTNGNEELICPVNTNPNTDGDEVADTDPHKKSWNCFSASDINDCTGLVWGNSRTNIMSYFSCRDRFTPGQGDRLQATMLTERYSLIASLGDQPPAGTSVKPISHETTVENTNSGTAMGPVLVKLNTLYYQSDGYRSESKIAYEDKTCTMGTTINRSGNYTIEINTVSNRQLVKVWIDLNNDGLYGAGELVGSSSPSGTGDQVHSIPLPASLLATASAFNTPLRMRVAADWYTNDYLYDSKLQYGQMEDFAVTIENATLPVNFGDITAVFKDGRLQVNWSTITEINNSHFEIEASADGKTFSKIGEINSLATNGSSNKELKYSFSKNAADAAAWLGLSLLTFVLGLGSTTKNRNKKLNTILVLTSILLLGFGACNKKDVSDAIDSSKSVFIRIKQVDKDGGFKYSNSIKVVRQ